MNLREERMQWQHDARNIERYVDHLVNVLKEDANAEPVAYMAVDMVYRQYVQWLHSAQLADVDAPLTRNSGVHLINMMIIEMCRRMNNMKGDMKNAREWIGEFMETLNEEIDADLEEIGARNANRQASQRDDN